jgi:hypothetical protein
MWRTGKKYTTSASENLAAAGMGMHETRKTKVMHAADRHVRRRRPFDRYQADMETLLDAVRLTRKAALRRRFRLPVRSSWWHLWSALFRWRRSSSLRSTTN